MKEKNQMGTGDFQKLLQLAMAHLTMKRTILESQMYQLNDELRTLERDEELEKLEMMLLDVKKDQDHYQQFIDEKHPFELENEILF